MTTDNKSNELTERYTSNELIAFKIIDLIAEYKISIWDAEEVLDRAKSFLKSQLVVPSSTL